MFEGEDNIFPNKPDIAIQDSKSKAFKTLLPFILFLVLFFTLFSDNYLLIGEILGVLFFHEFGHIIMMKYFLDSNCNWILNQPDQKFRADHHPPDQIRSDLIRSGGAWADQIWSDQIGVLFIPGVGCSSTSSTYHARARGIVHHELTNVNVTDVRPSLVVSLSGFHSRRRGSETQVKPYQPVFQDLKEAIELDPHNPQLLDLRASVYFR